MSSFERSAERPDPCPFCGQGLTEFESYPFGYVCLRHDNPLCILSGVRFSDDADHVRGWNERTGDPAVLLPLVQDVMEELLDQRVFQFAGVTRFTLHSAAVAMGAARLIQEIERRTSNAQKDEA